MTGGGFGGCTVNLVQKSQLEAVTTALKAQYQAEYGREPEVFVTEAGDGAREEA